MLKVVYDEYWNDNKKFHRIDYYKSLEAVSDWIFEQMRWDYTKDNNPAISFPRKDRNGVYPETPTSIHFRPSEMSADYTIHMISNDRGIIFSDGEFTCGQKHWTREVRDWCIKCEERRKHPFFNFVNDDTPAEAPRSYIVCYRESCVRDVEVCIKDPVKSDPVDEGWLPLESALVFAGLYRAASEELAIEAAANAEGCDKGCLTVIPMRQNG